MTDSVRRKAATLSDVADMLGLAPSTISRALTTPDRVNSATRERIERAAADIGYVSPRAAASTASRTRAVAVLVSDITNPFFFGIIRGTQMQLKAAGYRQILVDTEESGELEAATLTALGTSAVGAVVTASRLPDADLAAFADTLPLVAINRRPDGVPNILIDTPGGVAQALEHLYSLGHREIVYVSGPVSSWSNERRWKALERSAEHLGITPQRVGPFTPTTAAGAIAADVALTTGATACIVFNDLIAIGMLSRLRERGIGVPGDISIVGCDDIFGADFCNPPLTTLHAPIERAGRVAVSMLLARIDAGTGDTSERQSVLLPTTLTVRSTTGPAPTRKARR
ncbi:LacI family transcriptional regulator [Frondihabitans sp. PAMC 28766]|uniref:LacI family DNA-binding transcriptional regulator n=1 Tax=Frondihabitans sp. PAMC 28766 TaxID=1795630 RepID=UPI00078EF676|nr:LacI family DNA-binding transcriptional regulator [Frondihabitans sp. PAMC 28766]AMM20353.1 LacI family transcriptional regulator [Frondihabitans sp. PAMC 28766]